MPIASFSLVALDCPDPHALAAFYQKIVGGQIRPATLSNPDWARLEIDGASDIAFQRDPDHQRPRWPDGVPQQAHIDFDVADLDAGESDVLAIGAIKSETQPEPDEWRVFIDPAGHPFCLVKV